MWSVNLVMSRLLGSHSMSACRWLEEKLGDQQSTVCWSSLPGDCCRQNAAIVNWVSRRQTRKGWGTPRQVRGRLYMSTRRSWTWFSTWCIEMLVLKKATLRHGEYNMSLMTYP